MIKNLGYLGRSVPQPAYGFAEDDNFDAMNAGAIVDWHKKNLS